MKPIIKVIDEMNKTEARYANHLEVLKHAKEIIDWKFEKIRFKLAEKTTYTPDFFVTYPDRFEFHEIKGYRTGRHAHSNVKFKTAAMMYPWFVWQMIKLERNTWKVMVEL
jgi:uncharacterized protein YwgA